MKYVKMLGLAAVAAAALMAFVGAGTASAANLYSTGVKLAVGQEIHASLEGGTAVLSTTDEKTLVDTCPEGTVKGKISSTGGATVTGNIETLTWSSKCTQTTDTLTNGVLHITSAGAVTGSGSVVTVNFAGVSCRYGTGASTSLGTLTTGTLAVNAVINEQEPKQFLCPDTTKWVAKYTVTTPHDLTAGA